MAIYDREEFERSLTRVKNGEVGAIYWAKEDIARAFYNAKNVIALDRATESDKAEMLLAAADAQRLAVAVNSLIDKQLKERQGD